MKESATVALEPYVGGSINSIAVGGRALSSFSNGFHVAPERFISEQWHSKLSIPDAISSPR
jgi:hypothetical protein